MWSLELEGACAHSCKGPPDSKFWRFDPSGLLHFPRKDLLDSSQLFPGKMAQTAIIAMGVIWYGTLEIPDTQVDYMN